LKEAFSEIYGVEMGFGVVPKKLKLSPDLIYSKFDKLELSW
jgi:hypothetical protein